MPMHRKHKAQLNNRSLLVAVPLALLAMSSAIGAGIDESMRKASLAQRIEKLEAIKAVERLQYAYGYYQDRFLFDQLPALFASKGTAAHFDGGVWEGPDGVRRLWTGYFRNTYAKGATGPVAGRMFDLPQWQSVVTISADGLSARGRFRTVGELAIYREMEDMVAGVYENDFIKENGLWKFKSLRFCTTWRAPYGDGWKDIEASSPHRLSLFPESPDGPDRVASKDELCSDRYPENAGVMPFHFVNPGKVTKASQVATPIAGLLGVTDLERRAASLKSANEIERFHNIFLYQQDNRLFDYQVDLFSELPGSESVFFNGVFSGRNGQRRLWAGRFGGAIRGVNMPVFGYLIDNHGGQGIIDIAPDGQSAVSRFRTSRDPGLVYQGMGVGGDSSIGIYQSKVYRAQYVKEDGVWKFYKWSVCIYAQGYIGSGYAVLPKAGRMGIPLDFRAEDWKKLDFTQDVIVKSEGAVGQGNELYPLRPLGPDRVMSTEESGCYLARNQVMSLASIVPFHFLHPVTGQAVTWPNK